MTTNPIFFWTTFAGLFLGSQFIPVFEFHKPDQEASRSIYVWTLYADAGEVLGAGPTAASLLTIVAGTLIHVSIVSALAMLATGIYRYLGAPGQQVPPVLASPEPTRSEWETFLAGHDKD